MKMKIDKFLTYYLYAFAYIYVSTVVIGIFNNYSAVPYWDMWSGYLEFYTKVQSGDWYAWIAQHNEHRIFLSRILFWFDIHFFNGASYFLLICNFALLSAIAYSFYKFISNLFDEKSNTRKWLILIITILSFSWIQNENITWGFQSQFFLAYLVPLVSFYLLAKYIQERNDAYFILSLITGILSVFTMGNGIATLPLLFFLGVILRISKLRQLTILIATLATLYLYFLDYTSVAGHGSVSETFLQHTKNFFLYIFTYLGGPFSKIFGSSALYIIQIFGVLFIVSSLYFAVITYRNKENVFIFALLTFIVYVGVTAFGTAGGRAIFGLNHALTSRYMTPSLMGWSTLLILFIYFYHKNLQILKYIRVLFFIIPLLFLYQQSEALKYHSDSEQRVAAVALELSIKDETLLKTIFPSSDRLMQIVKVPREKNLSIFDDELIRDVSLKIGESIEQLPRENLQGALDEVQNIVNFTRIRGWLFDKQNQSIPKNAFLVDDKGIIIGYVLTGFKRDDVANLVDKKAKYSGFYGYLVNNYEGNKFYLVNEESNKKLEVKLQESLVNYSDTRNIFKLESAPVSSIISSSFQKNKIYDYKPLCEFEIYGSFIDGDKSKAFIKIDMASNKKLLYKTGPSVNGQFIKIYKNGNNIYTDRLSASSEWQTISFDENLNNFSIEIVDDSSNWGEWSAVALQVKDEE